MLISLEGIDGSGKSTQARLLEQRLQSEGVPVILVREPGGTEVSERIRALLLDHTLHIAPFVEVLLFSAARGQLVEEKIVPALAAGVVVVCDRFYDSTTAYQGGGRGVADREWMRDFHLRVTAGVVPDRTFLIELDAEEAIRRRGLRRTGESGSSTEDRIEAAGVDFQHEVARAYAVIAGEEPSRVRRLDGRMSEDAIHEEIWRDVQAALQETSTPRSGSSS